MHDVLNLTNVSKYQSGLRTSFQRVYNKVMIGQPNVYDGSMFCLKFNNSRQLDPIDNYPSAVDFFSVCSLIGGNQVFAQFLASCAMRIVIRGGWQDDPALSAPDVELYV